MNRESQEMDRKKEEKIKNKNTKGKWKEETYKRNEFHHEFSSIFFQLLWNELFFPSKIMLFISVFAKNKKRMNEITILNVYTNSSYS